MKRLLQTIALSALLSTVMAAVAMAQTQLAPDERQAPANAPYITGTGATVAHPGQSQSGGTTSLDRGVQSRDNQIDNSICKGC